ncbi:thiamine-phosphate kinase [Halomonas denitrificans]|uniref:thiamine-phosphate kinase n=1 Tax=Halomonas denitrificans TaxID=370769 RepID=UPI001C99CD24|nr:thiamine-phosphate kinase [Halomonas denitrificans]MBY5968432.1 thiamine-phosphate kinase [Halomonas denitrificans]
MYGEFELIQRWLAPARPGSADASGVSLGVGDDASLMQPTPGHELVVSVDTSVEGQHFPPGAPAAALGHRAVAVSLSDLAAMGARPRWCLMALTLPDANDDWVAEFARGFHAVCDSAGMVLVGGDVTRGQRAISVTVMGEVPTGQALRRDGAKAGDVLAVTGALGGGAGGLAAWQGGARDMEQPLLKRYLLPEARWQAGEVLRGLANAAIDVSDGLLADLDHVLSASGVGAVLDSASLPLADGLAARLGQDAAIEAALCGGDDYELLVSLPPSRVAQAKASLLALGIELTPIGHLTETPGIQGVKIPSRAGWQHFHGGTS